METFNPLAAFGGGVLIGGAALLLMLVNGRVAGISGILGGLLSPRPGDIAWRAGFIAGLPGGGLVFLWLHEGSLGVSLVASWPQTVLAGLLVGFGTRMGSGCTSGHGVCGIGRLSRRSLVATLVFIATGMATVLALRLLGLFHGG